MAISKNAADKPKAAAKTKPAPTGGAAALSIKPAQVIVPEVSVVGAVPEQSADGNVSQVKKQELVERVATASGAKKKDVKLIVEAALAVLGDALSAGEELNLPPLGKIKVNRQKTEGGAEVLILKLRRGGGKSVSGGSNEGLAAEDEDD